MSGTDSTPRAAGGRLPERLAGRSEGNYLVIGPPLAGTDAFARRTLEAARDRGRDPLLVTTTRGAPRLLDGVEGVAAVDCTPLDADGERVTSVGSPADLTGASMPVSEFVRDATRPVVAFDSVSTLLMYVDPEPAFRFFSVLTSHVSNADGLGLYTLNRNTRNEETVRTFAQLFDGRIELPDDGDGVRTEGVDGLADGRHPG